MRRPRILFTVRTMMVAVAVVAIECFAVVALPEDPIVAILLFGPLVGALSVRFQPHELSGYVRGGIKGGVVQGAVLGTLLVGYVVFLWATKPYRDDMSWVSLLFNLQALLILSIIAGSV